MGQLSKMDEPIKMLFGRLTQYQSTETCIRWGSKTDKSVQHYKGPTFTCFSTVPAYDGQIE